MGIDPTQVGSHTFLFLPSDTSDFPEKNISPFAAVTLVFLDDPTRAFRYSLDVRLMTNIRSQSTGTFWGRSDGFFHNHRYPTKNRSKTKAEKGKQSKSAVMADRCKSEG